MSKIRPLNRDSLSDEDAPVLRKELQEEIALEMYNNALRFQAKDKYEQARELLFTLINENIPQIENQGGLPKFMSTLKYSCFLNIGNIYLAEKQNGNALDNYLMASELDDTDVTLWYKIGKLALKENRFKQSVYAFSKGLDCNDSHWPCLDEIIPLLFAMRDTISCLYYIGKALILDSNYVKGIVLRKQIYKDNPAAEEYYQKSNPDYILEPATIDIKISAIDEEKYLGEVQKIMDEISKVEMEFETKPLQTIPLPKGLEDYSWLALGKTILSLHQHLQTNEMSFLTFVDINKCMNQTLEKTEVKIESSDEVKMEIEESVQENKTTSEEIVEEKMNAVQTATATAIDQSIIIEQRRSSQNSEENGFLSQTDNDEEQQTEQDDEEPEEKLRNSNSNSKSLKRKRDLLLDLKVWGWHSKRKHVRKSKPDKFYTVEDCLNQILPQNLLRHKVGDLYQQNDSLNTTDLYNLFLEDNRQVNILSPIHSPQNNNANGEFYEYFGSDKEKEDVMNLWTKSREYCDVCELVKEFVHEISTLWNYKWPSDELIEVYIHSYEVYRSFYQLPHLFELENEFEDVKKEVLSTLLYAELVLFSCPTNMEKDRLLHVGHVQFVEFMISWWEQCWGESYITTYSRIFWLKTYIHRKETNNELAVTCLQLIEDALRSEEEKLGEKFCITLPNSKKCSFISIEVTTKILKHLDMVKSISGLLDLYTSEKYEEVAEIVKSTFNSNTGYPTFGKVGRPAQIGLLLHSLWFTNIEQCFLWSEECLFEAIPLYTRPGNDRTRWEKIVEKCLAIMHEIIKSKSRNILDVLDDNKKARLTESLSKIICKQINSENSNCIPLNTIIPWILLHHILVKNQLDKAENFEETEEVPTSLSIIFSAHEFLGPKNWCLTNQGELLHFLLDILLDKEYAVKYEKLRDKIDIQIEQAFFCLYQHPSKKNKISRHLADHNVDPLPLTWEKSFQLYEFYAPEALPEFNSFKNASITMDLEQLLLRITALVLPECDPSSSIPKINEYLQGKIEKIPDPIEFPNRIRAIYYLLGDYYFKQRLFNNCIKYFLMDLAINPSRIDSWACLGLGFFSQLEINLNHCEKIKSEEEFLAKAKNAKISFETALKLSQNDIILWIEFGSFEYMAHSFCSRYLKFESENMSMERFEFLEGEKNAFLDSSRKSFERAIALYGLNENEIDERWLHYYVLGKIAEKKHKEPSEYLNYYLKASELLDENKACYPDKIHYNSPQHLSIEALEIHYRINASVLKYLELHEGKEISTVVGNLFKKILDSLPINKKIAEQKALKKIEKIAAIKLLEEKKKIDFEIENGVKECVESILERVEELEIAEKKIIEQKQSELMDTTKVGKDKPIVQVVDEVILVDSEYDVIMILSSDDEEVDATKSDNAENRDKKRENPIEIEQVETSNAARAEQAETEPEIGAEKNCTAPPPPPLCEKATNQELPENSKKNENGINPSSSSSSSSTDTSSSSSDSDSDDTENNSSTSSSSSEDSQNENLSSTELSHLIDRCVRGLEQCILRFPKNYKAIYRLVHLFFNYKLKKDVNKCKQLLLSEYKCYENNTTTNGLFSDRKAANFFNGIWRIPSSEVDRPGSLAAHMSRCLTILLQVLRVSNDYKILLDIYFQLRKAPDPDKIYIKDSERLQFSEQAFALCVQSFKNSIKSSKESGNIALKKLLHDIYRAYIRIQKHVPEKEVAFSQMLVEAYKNFIKEKIAENTNVLELAVKFCQQTKVVEKQRIIPQNQNLNHNPLVPIGPVLPTPSSVNSTNVRKSLSGTGRPRGRPPLPKSNQSNASTSLKTQRKNSTSFSAASAWSNTKLDLPLQYEYFKHYQEELLKQYNQNLSYMQMAQLAQMYNPYLQGGGNLMTGLTNKAQIDAMQSKFNEIMNLLKPQQSATFSQSLSNFTIDQLMASSRKDKATTSTIVSAPSTSMSSTSAIEIIPKSKDKDKDKIKSPKMAPVSIVTKEKELKTEDKKIVPSITISPKRLQPIKDVPSLNIEAVITKVSSPTSKFLDINITKSVQSSMKSPSGSSKTASVSNKASSAPLAAPTTLIKPQSSMSKCLPTLTKAPSTLTKAPSAFTKAQASSSAFTKAPPTLSKAPPTLTKTPSTFTKAPSASSSSTMKGSTVNMQNPKTQQRITSTFSSAASTSLGMNLQLQSAMSHKLPSSITLTPAQTPQSVSTPESGNKQQPFVAVKKLSSSSLSGVSNLLKLPSGIELRQKQIVKSTSGPSTNPFSIESMLQTSPSSRANYNSSSSTTFQTNAVQQQSQPQKVVRTTSVITSTNKIERSNVNVNVQAGRSSDLYKSAPVVIGLYPKQKASTSGTIVSKSSPTSVISSAKPSAQTSPCKTLQEKLADKKREQANKQLFEQQQQKERVVATTQSSFVNPHPISKMLSSYQHPGSELEIITVPPPMKISKKRKSSTSDDSVILVD